MKARGFTLVELLVAISIIAVLTAVLLPNFMGARERARDAKKKQNLYAIKNALRMYYNDNQIYPPKLVGPEFSLPDTSGSGVLGVLASYLPNAASMGVGFTYVQVSNGDGFQMCALMESPSGSDNVDSQTNCADGGGLVCGVATGSTSTYVVCAR